MELIDNLKLKSDFVGKVFYEELGTAPRRVNGVAGTYQRHIVNNERHGVFHIITPALPEVFQFDDEVEIDGECYFLEDTSWNGQDVSPAMNVLAKKLKRVGGNK
ncbi:cytoplasmic protein [Streptococcus sp. H31]|uniref:cytoplasmic protein n=1 Tax=Streptococcus huangxiaojuni TaxID=3237239 RepID=UPI0034A565C3